MTQIDSLIEEIKKATDTNEKLSLMMVMLHVFDKTKPKFKFQQRKYFFDFAVEELKPLEQKIEDAKNYRERDVLFGYVDKLLTLIMITEYADETSAQILIHLFETINRFRKLENRIDEVFSKDRITKSDVERILEIVNDINDIYEKGKLFSGLMHFEKKFDNIDDDAKELLVKFLNKETLEGVIAFDKLSEDGRYNLELLCDLLRVFFNKDTVRILKTAEKIDNPAIKFYSADSLLELDEKPEQETVDFLSKNDVFACDMYKSLKRNGLVGMFPEKLRNDEYLSKSDMVHWLCFPTELGKVPDEIQFLGKVKKRKNTYFVFKFKSESDNLAEEKKNVWLVGWSCKNGETFSDFDSLSDFEKTTLEKTLKAIRKKIV